MPDDSTLYTKFQKPDGDIVILPAVNRETYIAKGYKDVGRTHLQPGEYAPHVQAAPSDLVHETPHSEPEPEAPAEGPAPRKK